LVMFLVLLVLAPCAPRHRRTPYNTILRHFSAGWLIYIEPMSAGARQATSGAEADPIYCSAVHRRYFKQQRAGGRSERAPRSNRSVAMPARAVTKLFLFTCDQPSLTVLNGEPPDSECKRQTVLGYLGLEKCSHERRTGYKLGFLVQNEARASSPGNCLFKGSAYSLTQ
jgi:hypothetical protein